jgi:class 3 adenylate cyclase
VLYAESGRFDEARNWFDKMAANNFDDVPRDINWTTSFALVAYLSCMLGDATRGEIALRMLEPYATRCTVAGFAVLCQGSASGSLGDAATACRRFDEARDYYEYAIDWDERTGARPRSARSRLALAQMLHAEGRRGYETRALELVNAALVTFEELGMPTFMERALALKLELQGAQSSGIYTSIDSVARAVERERPRLSVHPAPDGTVTLMFSDIEDSTVLTERLGDQAWQELLRRHNGLIREQIKAHDGFEVKTMGDGFMVAFQSAKKGLDCAIAIQRAFHGHNDEHGEHVKVRIGLHAGEAIKDGDDFYGKNVIMASRVAGKAVGGEILVSSLLRSLVESSVGAGTFTESRDVELKGLSGTHTVFSVSVT